MADTASAFTIQEITGDQREFRFTGRALPYRPFTISGTQRHDLTWYAGSPEGTLQILGAKEEDTSINGWWKDRFLMPIDAMAVDTRIEAGLASSTAQAAGQNGELGAQINGQPVENVRGLAEAVDDMRRKGQLVEVTWMSIVRRGIIKSFRQTWHTAQDLEWELQFAWVNQGSDLAELPVVDSSIDTSDSVVEIL